MCRVFHLSVIKKMTKLIHTFIQTERISVEYLPGYVETEISESISGEPPRKGFQNLEYISWHPSNVIANMFYKL